MPKSKKIDPTKRGDLSMAQFVYDGEPAATAVPSLKPSAPATATATTATATTTSSTFAPTTPMEADQPADTDKEKDKDKKEKEKDSHVTIEDLSLPKSIITRLAKGVLPPNTQIQANAITAMTKSATVFINHLANAANENTLNNHKKTIMPGDVFAALEEVEFPFFRERLEAEFKKFNETQTTKRNTYRRKVAAQKRADKSAAATTSDPNASMMSTASGATETDSAPRSKKQKPNDADESAMEVDGDETQEPRDASDPETEPEQEEEDDEDEEEEQENEEEEDEGENDHDLPDRLEERENRDEDDALDDGPDSD